MVQEKNLLLIKKIENLGWVRGNPNHNKKMKFVRGVRGSPIYE